MSAKPSARRSASAATNTDRPRADYKRGTPFNPEHDVHAAAGVTCTDCHKVDHHKIARGSRVTDMHAWERQNVEVDCCQLPQRDRAAQSPGLGDV